MKIAVLKEARKGEARVAASPDSVRRMAAWGADVSVAAGAGKAAGIADKAYSDAGATVARKTDSLVGKADVVLCVNAPEPDGEAVAAMKDGAALVGMLAPLQEPATIQAYAEKGLASFALEFLPRISRAQSMDVLSSQSNLAGYRAVIEAAAELGKAMPMMMTAAGTVPPAKVLVLGAGVAGLQAIATAKRLGAVVSAFDVRPEVKEQVESLGATFVEVKAEEADTASDGSGYAREMSEEYKKRQQALIADTVAAQDIVITTALIPGKPAPELITEAMVKSMKPGAVIVDLAAAAGGNYPGTQADKVVTKHGVKVIGYTNLPSHVAADATPLYARNLYNFLELLVSREEDTPRLTLDSEDEIVQACLLTRDGKVVHERLG